MRDYFRYLKEDQYADASNLNARAQLHNRFSTDEDGLHAWIFGQLLEQNPEQLLELGSGPGHLWVENSERIPSTWRITLTDISDGMLRDLETVVPSSPSKIDLLACDAQWLPFSPNHFDTVIANHMLYHLRDIDQGISEIARVLAAGGVLLASTNGVDHMREIRELVHSLSDEIVFGSKDLRRDLSDLFSREKGSEILAGHFQEVEWIEFDDDLVVTEVEPLLRYVLSFPGNARQVFGPKEMLVKLQQAIEARMDRDGALHITKAVGLFIARKS